MAFEDDAWQAIRTRIVPGAKTPRWRRRILDPKEVTPLNFWTDIHQQGKCFTWKLVKKGNAKNTNTKPTEVWHLETPGETYSRMPRALPGQCGPINMYDENFADVMLQHLGTPRQQATSIHLYKIRTPFLARCVNRAKTLPGVTKNNAIIAKLGYLMRTLCRVFPG